MLGGRQMLQFTEDNGGGEGGTAASTWTACKDAIFFTPCIFT